MKAMQNSIHFILHPSAFILQNTRPLPQAVLTCTLDRSTL